MTELLISGLLTLLVVMLGWLHHRLTKMEKQHTDAIGRLESHRRDSINRLYDHVGGSYAKREVVDDLGRRISELVGRIDQLMQIMIKQTGDKQR